MVKLFSFVSLCLLLTGATVANAAGSPPAAFGKIVSQSFDKTQDVTETHLANGLTILSKESHAAPVVYFSVWYRVGSRDELSGQTGLSHILEHMMFKGTKDLPPGAIDHLFLSNGGLINASTSEDRTEYHELIADDKLELSIRVEADRMENSVFDPTELKHEMEVVRSELEGDANDPDSQLETVAFLPTAFVAHPYHWPTIGWTRDVESAAEHREVIYKYYTDHYVPSNAVVVMVGDFDTKKAVSLCQQYFGVYPAGKAATHFITPEPAQTGERRAILKRPGTTGHVLMGFHEPGTGTPDHFVMEVISQILSGGRSARLSQDLVDSGTATNARASVSDHKDPYLFEFEASPGSDVSNADIEAALDKEITQLQTTPVTAEEVTRAVRRIEARYVFDNDSVTRQAGQLGRAEMVGSFTDLDNYLDHIRAVTPADIQRVASKYFVPDNRTVAIFEPQPLPLGQGAAPAPGEKNFGAMPPLTDPRQKAILAALDRQFNVAAHASSAKSAAPARFVLPNGMVLIVLENHANHTVAMSGMTRAGGLYDPTGKWGVAQFTAGMLRRGTTAHSALQLALGLESVGATVGITSDVEGVRFTGSCLSQDFGLTLNTLSEELLHPAFPADQIERTRRASLSGLQRAKQDTGGTRGAGAQASIAFAQALYPVGHPYWSPSIEDSETALRSITVDDLKSFYGTYYRPDTSVLVIVGDVTAADALKAVTTAFGDWTKPSAPKPELHIADVPLPATGSPTRVVALPGASQTSILWGYPGQLKRTDPDYYPAYVMNFILGGDTFGSRLGKTIRDESGLAYSVNSQSLATHGAGPIQVFVGTNPNNAERAIYELRQITATMRKSGVTPDEVRQAKLYLNGSFPLRLETNTGIAGQLLTSEEFGLGLDFIRKRSAIIDAITVAQVNAAIAKYLQPDHAVLVIAGAVPGK